MHRDRAVIHSKTAPQWRNWQTPMGPLLKWIKHRFPKPAIPVQVRAVPPGNTLFSAYANSLQERKLEENWPGC